MSLDAKELGRNPPRMARIACTYVCASRWCRKDGNHKRCGHRCGMCRAKDGAEKVFRCSDCKQWTPWSEGGTDDERCAACWASAKKAAP